MEKLNLRKYKDKIVNSRYISLIVFFTIMLLIFSLITLREGSDDYKYMQALGEMSILEWVYLRATTWQPRLSSDFSLALVNFNMPLWRILSSLLVTIGVFCIGKVAMVNCDDKKKNRIIYSLLCCSFFMICPYVITSSVLWFTGSFHYLWPTVAMLVALIPFCYAIYGKQVEYKVLYYIIIFCSIYASYTEYNIAILLCFGLMCFGFMKLNKIRISKRLMYQYLIILVNSTFFIVVNAFADRGTQELHWYPEYEMLTIVDRIFQGVNHTNFHFINSSNLILLFASILLFMVIRKKYKGIIKLFSSMPMIFLLGKMIPFDILLSNVNRNNEFQMRFTGSSSPYEFENVLDKVLYNTMIANPSNLLTSVKDLLPSITGLTIMLFISILLYFAFDTIQDRFIAIVLYLAMLASGYIISFSPTIFASGSRIFFTGNILLMIIVGKLIVRFMQEYSEEVIDKSRGAYYLILAITGLIIIQYIVKFQGDILWL